jgi:hypothetical protein
MHDLRAILTPAPCSGHHVNAVFIRCAPALSMPVGREAFARSKRKRRTEVAAAFYTLCETARLVGVDLRAYLPRAVYAAIGRPGTVTFPEDLLASTLTG